ncbi:multidrug ABC transporter ATP-binding protein [Agromyces aureus]|uniref:Multidrug ABC transporter ATP-binding protein n=2 Tax=Agromyces aureus TaxID=453304 RepID=A0A191WKM2_9MICO|nr:multidrug ABC transporter ATP-binding protein [Agromyces aureus]
MRYGTHDVLRDVSFEVARGEVLALLGPNGAGKTSTIEVLEGLRRRSAGRVEVLGVDPEHADERWRARVGIVLQSWRDHAKWRVRELLEYQGSLAAPYATESVPRPWSADALLDAVGLAEQSDRMVKSLSGGQRRRLDVAIGLVGCPELVFFDEPTAGLDPQARRDFHELVRRITREFDATVLLTTHDLVEADELADRIAILTERRIVADGTADELARQIVGDDEVRWKFEGRPLTRHGSDATAFVRRLLEQHEHGITELEVRRASLEDTYLALVQAAEAARPRREALTAAGAGR